MRRSIEPDGCSSAIHLTFPCWSNCWCRYLCCLYITRFFYGQRFFQLSFIIAAKRFTELGLKYCLGVALGILSYRDTLYRVYLSLSLCLRLLCLIYVIYFSIFITIIHMISLEQTNFFFGNVWQTFSLKVLLSF